MYTGLPRGRAWIFQRYEGPNEGYTMNGNERVRIIKQGRWSKNPQETPCPTNHSNLVPGYVRGQYLRARYAQKVYNLDCSLKGIPFRGALYRLKVAYSTVYSSYCYV